MRAAARRGKGDIAFDCPKLQCERGDDLEARMINRREQANLILSPRCLAVFVDDSGHEELKGQKYYGLGGCAVLRA